MSASGDVYVLGHDGVIHRYKRWGGLLASWSGGTFGPLSMPKGLDVDAGGNVYVADSFNNRILVFGRNGEALIQWSHDFGYPRDVVRGLGDDIFVADTFHSRVQRFAANETGSCGPPPPPLPGGDQVGIALLLHVLPVPEASDCSQGVPANCVDARAQCGISYQSGEPGDVQDGAGIDIFDWHLCATLQFPTTSPAWPEPGSGTLLTWDPIQRCQTAQTAVAGWFYLAAYSPDVLQLTPHPIDGLAKLATCTSREGIISPNRLGSAAFSVSGLVPGCNPCVVARCNEPVSVRPSTWSAIKVMIGGGS